MTIARQTAAPFPIGGLPDCRGQGPGLSLSTPRRRLPSPGLAGGLKGPEPDGAKHAAFMMLRRAGPPSGGVHATGIQGNPARLFTPPLTPASSRRTDTLRTTLAEAQGRTIRVIGN